MRNLFCILILSLFISPGEAAGAENDKVSAAEVERFAVYYADTETPDHFKPYQLIVLDGTHHPNLQPLKEDGKLLLGYLSLGEVPKTSPFYAMLAKKNLILQENPNWKDSFYVDVRDPLWAKLVLEELVPAILRQGFDGLFLDTLDDPIALEKNNHDRYAGMSDAAAHLVEAIRLHYPSIKIMMNRAYPLLPKVGSLLDYELGESVYAVYDFAKKSYGKTPETAYQDQVQILQDAKKKNPQIKIYTLDYANPTDRTTIAEIYQTERANGFIPYVATIGLDRLVEEPGSP